MTTVFLILLGACLGSFIPCFAERRAAQESQWTRSHCDHCGRTIAPLYLIPVAGYFLARGRCSHCQAAIPRIYPLLEALGAVIAGCFAMQHAPFGHSMLLIATASMLLLLSLDDWQSQLIYTSDLVLYALLLLIDLWLYGAHWWPDRLLGAAIVALPLLGIYLLRPDALGSGDIIFMAASGFYLGIVPTTYAFLLAMVLALCYALYLLRGKAASQSTAIPLIPFLALGVLSQLLLSYNNIF